MLLAALIALPLTAAPASAASDTNLVWRGESAELLLVNERHINAKQAAAVARKHGFQVVSVKKQHEVFVIQAKKKGKPFVVRVSDEGHFLGAKAVPVKKKPRHRDHDDD
jgi:hypothetical protein